jgi:hypothetical protein
MTTRFLETDHDRRMLFRFIDVPGFAEYYEFNLAGEVRTKPRYANSPICGGRRLIPSRKVNVRTVKGYPAFLASVAGKKTTVYIHRCIAKVFIPNPDGKPHINHKDGDKANFDPANLEWCTHRENMAHAYRTGLAIAPTSGPGELSPAARLTADQVRSIRQRLEGGESRERLAREFGMSLSNIGQIARRQTWVDV